MHEAQERIQRQSLQLRSARLWRGGSGRNLRPAALSAAVRSSSATALDLPQDPLPLYTYRVLSRIPDFLPLGGMVLGGVWWITHRREEVAAAEGEGQRKPEQGRRTMKFKFTFWKLVFAVIMARGAYGTYHPLLPGPGRLHQFERPVPLGHLDWL